MLLEKLTPSLPQKRTLAWKFILQLAELSQEGLQSWIIGHLLCWRGIVAMSGRGEQSQNQDTKKDGACQRMEK